MHVRTASVALSIALFLVAGSAHAPNSAPQAVFPAGGAAGTWMGWVDVAGNREWYWGFGYQMAARGFAVLDTMTSWLHRHTAR